MQDDARLCTATRRDGTPCTGRALPSSAEQRCFAHDAERQAALKASRAAGGKAKARTARAQRLVPAVLRPLLDSLLEAVGECHDGTLTASRATAMAALAGAVVKVYDVGQLEERLQAIEAEAARRQA